MKHILKCNKCDKYTLEGVCPDCGSKTFSAIPPKYSPEDKYAKFRRIEKRDLFLEKGLI